MDDFRLLTATEFNSSKAPRMATRHRRCERVLAEITQSTLDLSGYADQFHRVATEFRCNYSLTARGDAEAPEEQFDGTVALRPRLVSPSTYAMQNSWCTLSVGCIAGARTLAVVLEACDLPFPTDELFWIEYPQVQGGNDVELVIDPPAWRDYIDDPYLLAGQVLKQTGPCDLFRTELLAVFRRGSVWFAAFEVAKTARRLELPLQLRSKASEALGIKTDKNDY